MFPHTQHAQVLLDMSQYLRAVMAQRLVPSKDGRRAAAVEIMLNTPHISELMRKGDVSSIKEAITASAEKGIQSFDHSLVALYKAGRVKLEDALAHADSRSNLEARINFG
jgi:twitching motility protein PilU